MPHRPIRLLAILLLTSLAFPAAEPSLAQAPAGAPSQNVQGPAQYPQTQPRVAGPQAPPQAAGQGAVQGPPQAPQPPQAPFQLTEEQHAELVAVLRGWEQRSNKVSTLSCEFTRWDYNPLFSVKDPQNPNAVIPKQSQGVLKYARPDKGLYRIDEITECVGIENGEKKFATRKEGGEHWVCDGQSIFEYNYVKEQLIERRLPPSMQGKAITEGPLPFLFGAEADKLMTRYFLRVVTPPTVKNQIWLEAYPKYAMDAANFSRATLILDQKTMLPHAMEVMLPNGKERHVHQFSNNMVNDIFRIFKGDFSKPVLPRGWTKVEEPATPPPVSSLPGPQRG